MLAQKSELSLSLSLSLSPSPCFHQRRPKKGSRRCNNSQTSGEERALYGRAAPVMSDLPPKWSEAKDTDSGDTYFWNTDTNETSWDRPIAPSTAGPAPPPPPPRRREAVAAQPARPQPYLSYLPEALHAASTHGVWVRT